MRAAAVVEEETDQPEKDVAAIHNDAWDGRFIVYQKPQGRQGSSSSSLLRIGHGLLRLDA